MTPLARLRAQTEEEGSRLQVSCPCQHERQYHTFSEYLDAGGEVSVESPLVLRCPRCEREYAATATRDDAAAMVTVTLKEGAEMRDEPHFTVGDCPNCEAAIQNTDLTTGPGAPEIGWRYYECPACETCVHPRAYDD